MRSLIFGFFLAVFLGTLFLPSCRHELVLPITNDPVDTIQPPPPPPVDTGDYSGIPCDPDTVYFQNQVLPLLISQCAKSGCHDAQTHKEGVKLIDYQSVINTGKVKPFQPSSSKMYTMLNLSNPEDRMPPAPNSPLTTDQKNLIKKWIEQGALNNACNEGYGSCDTTNVTYTNFINPLLANRCTGCHSGANPSGGLKLTNYAETKASASGGKLYGSIAHLAGYKAMPQGGAALTSCYVDKVKAWINKGMPQ